MSKKMFSLGTLMGDSLKALGIEKQIIEQTCISAWDEIVGERIAAAAQPEFIKDGKIFVITKSPTWANELSFFKEDIIKRLNERVGGRPIKEMVFRAGKIEKKAKENEIEPEIMEIDLTGEEIKEVERAVKETAPELAGPAKKMLTEILKYDKWKQKKGWKPCKRCGALQNTENGICPPCEREGGREAAR
jgi:predicted nucleic acid-binding Zn ribbon protein